LEERDSQPEHEEEDVLRPVYEESTIEEEKVGVRLATEKESQYPDMDFEQMDLRVVPNPKKGFHYYVETMPTGLKDAKALMGCVADTGADAATASPVMVNRNLCLQRVQHDNGELDKPRALTDFVRMERPQHFYGFLGQEGGRRKVDVMFTLRVDMPMITDAGRMVECEFPDVRLVMGQEDELLTPPSVLDDARWRPP